MALVGLNVRIALIGGQRRRRPLKIDNWGFVQYRWRRSKTRRDWPPGRVTLWFENEGGRRRFLGQRGPGVRFGRGGHEGGRGSSKEVLLLQLCSHAVVTCRSPRIVLAVLARARPGSCGIPRRGNRLSQRPSRRRLPRGKWRASGRGDIAG